jgi:hypothetical protein
MTLGLAIRELHRSESLLARALAALAENHVSETEVHHVALDVRQWSVDHAERLRASGRARGERLWRWPHVVDPRPALVRATTRRDPALVLLADLRRLHRDAAGVSLDWELLAQGAQAVRDVELVDLCRRCHPQTLRQMQWSNGMLKTLSPQALSAR